MRIYIIRHGKAEKHASSGHDSDRRLTSRGERQAVWLGQTFASMDSAEAPDRLISSPVTRARQTAEGIRSAHPVDLTTDERLSTRTSVAAVVNLISGIAIEARRPFALVGHNPTLEDLLSVLVGNLTGDDAEMRTGQAAVLDLDVLEESAKLLRVLRMPDDGDD